MTPSQIVEEFVERLGYCGAVNISVGEPTDKGVIPIKADVPTYWRYPYSHVEWLELQGYPETIKGYWYYVPKFNRVKNWSGPSPYKIGAKCNLYRKCDICGQKMRKYSLYDGQHRECLIREPEYLYKRNHITGSCTGGDHGKCVGTTLGVAPDWTTHPCQCGCHQDA